MAGNLVFTRLAIGSRAACGLTQAGVVYCWGDNAFGELGDGTLTGRATPAPVAGDVRFSDITGGILHFCGLAQDGRALCWGFSSFGQAGVTGALMPCGNGLNACVWTPAAVAGDGRYASIAAGGYHSCALTDAGETYCWGNGLSFGGAGNSPVPQRVAAGRAFASLAAGVFHTCGLTAAGQVYCWGTSQQGELGTAGVTQSEPVQPVQGGRTWKAIFAGSHRTCAVTTTDALFCWGAGPTGDGTPDSRGVPAAVLAP